VRRLYPQEKRGVEAIALEDVGEGPVEMVGPFEGGSTQALDEFFSRAPSSPPPPPEGPPASAPPASRTSQAIPQVGAEARLAEAVRRLKLEDETTASRAMAARPVPPPLPAAGPAAPPAAPPAPDPAPAPAEPIATIELPLEAEVGADAELPDLSPRLHALLDALDRASRGGAAAPELARLARLSSALVRLLLRKGVVGEAELIAELVRK